jgi:hypothetical protein
VVVVEQVLEVELLELVAQVAVQMELLAEV